MTSNDYTRHADRSAVSAVRTLHAEVTENDGGEPKSYCAEDGYSWPCLTITALDEAGAA